MDWKNYVALAPVIATFVTAFATLIVAVVTKLQLKHSRTALGVGLLLKLEDRFDEPALKEARSSAAIALQAGHQTDDLEIVLDFFETLGLLIRKKTIDEELVWNSFSYWVMRYATLAKPQIERRRKDESDKTYYQEFDYLVERINYFEVKKRHLVATATITDNQIASFLSEESRCRPESPSV